MINLIVITDKKLGMADDHGIPWPPVDQDYFRKQTERHPTVMGFRTYQEFARPLPNRRNLVVVRPNTSLREGFEPIEDLAQFLKLNESQDIWIIGGAKLFAQTINQADQIYLTRLDQAFKTTKFFPRIPANFKLTKRSPTHQKEGLTFHFEIWQKARGATK
jgi:dihydrofolate reductase